MTCAAVVLFYPIMKYRGMTCFHPLPSIPKFIFDYFVMIVANEFLFYYFHRYADYLTMYDKILFLKRFYLLKVCCSILSIF